MHQYIKNPLINIEKFWAFLLTLDNVNLVDTSINKSTSLSLADEFIPLTPIHNTILSSSFKNSSVRKMARHINSKNLNNPLSCKKVILFGEDSPIATVLNSPIGSALSKLRKNQEIINSQKERIDQLENEMEKYAEKCDCFKNLVEKLETSKKRYIFFKS